MSKEALIANVQQIDPFQLLEKVDAFYNNAWIKLMVYITILIAFFGILIPFLIQWLQRKYFVLSEERIKNNLKEYCNSFKKEIVTEINQNVKKDIEGAREDFKKFKDDVSIEIDGARSLAFHLQGIIKDGEKDYSLALESYLNAIDGYVKGDDQRNLQRVLDAVVVCLNNLSSEDLDNIAHDRCYIDEEIDLLEKNNGGGKLTDFIRDVKVALSKAKQRKKSN